MPSPLSPRGKLTRIGNWTLGKTLGRGAYAHVRLAIHMSGRKAACKILPALHRDPNKPATWDQLVDAVEARKEIVLLKALTGAKVQGVIELEGVIEAGGWTYVFTALHSRSASELPEPWPHDQLVPFFRRLCYTLSALHSLNISHEDVKRSNILVDRLGCPVMIDFGFSHFACNGGWVKSAGGTFDYSSPEKVADYWYDPVSSDTWSLGIILMKMLGLPHPYVPQDEHDSHFHKQHFLDEDLDFQFRKEHYGPGRAASLILQILDKDPASRITIPEILNHNFLRTDRPDPHPFRPPPMTWPSRLSRPIPQSVTMDLCFLAYLNQEFFPCQTPKVILDRLDDPNACWLKRWAGMLAAWVVREEMDWEDISQVVDQKQVYGHRRNRDSVGSKRTILREINLTNSYKPSLAPVLVDADEDQAGPSTDWMKALQPDPGTFDFLHKAPSSSVLKRRHHIGSEVRNAQTKTFRPPKPSVMAKHRDENAIPSRVVEPGEMTTPKRNKVDIDGDIEMHVPRAPKKRHAQKGQKEKRGANKENELWSRAHNLSSPLVKPVPPRRSSRIAAAHIVRRRGRDPGPPIR